MTVEAQIYALLGALTDGRLYPDVAPAAAVPPYISYQIVGGSAVNLLEGAAPGKRNGRFQFNTWAATRKETLALAKNIEDALIISPDLRATVMGAAIWTYEEDLNLYGTHQDFSIWY